MSGKVWNSAGALISDGVSAFFDRLTPKPAPTTNQQLHEANLKQQHEEMRKLCDPTSSPVDWDAAERRRAERDAKPPTVSECIREPVHQIGETFADFEELEQRGRTSGCACS